MNKKKTTAVILAIAVIGLTVFIFSNSLTIGEESAEQSGRIAEFVEEIFQKFGLTFERDTLTLIIRKLAHFSEYFLLGALASGFINAITDKKGFISLSPVYCFIVAVCDEFICQRITEGRSPQWSDVMIDIGGAILASAIVLTAVLLVIKNKKGEQL